MNKASQKTENIEMLRPLNTIPMQHATFGLKKATPNATCDATTSLKALASKVLERNTQCNINATPPEKQRNIRRNNTPPNVALNLYSCAINELQKIAADDWPECERNPETLEAFARLVSTRRLREKGERPKDYTQASHCENCGPIWLWKGAPAIVQACTWCFNRVSGVAIPRPEQISCTQCQHFDPNDHSPNAGIGGCLKGLQGNFARQKHNCHRFHNKDIQS